MNDLRTRDSDWLSLSILREREGLLGCIDLVRRLRQHWDLWLLRYLLLLNRHGAGLLGHFEQNRFLLELKFEGLHFFLVKETSVNIHAVLQVVSAFHVRDVGLEILLD
jgi:hypothetical protein